MNVYELFGAFDRLIPPSLSCEWDNDGLMLCPDGGREVRRVLVTLDVTEAAAEHAINGGYDVIISHHPLIFKPLPSLVSPLILSLVKADISVFSFHTRLDALSGGVNSALAGALGLTDTEKLSDDMGLIGAAHRTMSASDYARHVKASLGSDRVTFIPSERKIGRVAVLGGAGKDYISVAAESGADVLVTGEVGYHAQLEAAERGLTVIEAGHYETEFPVCAALGRMLGQLSSEAGTDITADIFDSRRVRSV